MGKYSNLRFFNGVSHELNFNYIIAVDDFSFEEKNKNLINKKIKVLILLIE